MERDHQSVPRSDRQALVMRSEWRSLLLSEDHVPRRSTGHLRPLTRRCLSPALEHVDLFGDSLGYQAEPYLDMFFAQTHNYTVSNYTYGGTVTCDSHRVNYPR